MGTGNLCTGYLDSSEKGGKKKKDRFQPKVVANATRLRKRWRGLTRRWQRTFASG